MQKERGAPTRTKKMLQPKADYANSERDAKRARGEPRTMRPLNAMRRERGTPTPTKKTQTQHF
jgi:hypothetical protein